ncbi:MAG: DUF3696 domain-containing protein [Haliangiales bacterium]
MAGMIRLGALSVEGYKSFAAPTRVALRPLTLLYGRNNAGKSTLLRLLPMLAESVSSDAVAPLVLSGQAGRDAHYRDVVSHGRSHRRISLGLHWVDDGGPVGDDHITFDYVDEQDQLIVRRLELCAPSGEPRLVAEAEPYPDQGIFELARDGQRERRALSFTGLVPDAGDDELLAGLAERLGALRRQVMWLDSVRARPERLVRPPGAPRRLLGPDGRGAAEVLLSSSEVLDEVSAWYREALERDLEVKEITHPYHRVLLNPRRGGGGDIDLVDTGEGMAQVLPVLVAAAMARRSALPMYLAVEEPESHLHPNAQRALAAHLAELASSPSPPVMVLETHSRVLLLGVQLAVAEGRLDPARVAAYWVAADSDGASQLTEVSFDRQGRLKGWPRDAFAEDRALARELLSLQLGDSE